MKRKTLEEYQEEFCNVFPAYTIRRIHKKLEVYCKICAIDEYAGLGIGPIRFEVSPDNLRRNRLPCRCSNKYIWTANEQKHRISLKLAPKGAYFKSWEGHYRGVRGKFIAVCRKHGEWSTRIADVLAKSCSCPLCAKTGYSEHRKGTIYILSSKSSTKIGITNLSPQDRATYISRKSGEKFVVHNYWTWDDGTIARQVEALTLEKARLRYTNPSKVHHGYTECFVGMPTEEAEYMIISTLKELNYEFSAAF